MAKTLKVMLDEAQAQHNKVFKNGDIRQLPEIIDKYLDLLNYAPDEPSLVFLIATAHLQLGYNGMCITLLNHLLQSVTPQPEFYCNLGSAWKAEHNNEKARECWEKAMALREADEYYNNMATLYINEGNPKPGIEWADKALTLNPGNKKAHWNRALLLLEDGQFEKGWKDYDYGLLTGDRPARAFSQNPEAIPFYEGEPLGPDETIVIYGEQGLGDEIMFASALGDVIATGARVIYECHDRLEGVMKRTYGHLPNVEIFPTRKKNTIDWPLNRTIDYRCAIASLFRWFRKDNIYPQVPYFQVDRDLSQKYREMLKDLGPGPYVGFGYAGGAKRTHAQYRSSQLTPLLPIMEQECTLVSVQYTEDAADKFKRHEQNTGIKVHHFSDIIESHITNEAGERVEATGMDYDHSLALFDALDLVIVPNTTAVHACGAIGSEVWSLTPDACAYRYCNEPGVDHMRWYGEHVKLYRENGSKAGAIERMANDLKNFIEVYK